MAQYETVNRDVLRLGDEVYFYHRELRVEGVVEKVNRRSIKVRQTNDCSRHTRTAFGKRGGRRQGGVDSVWTVSVGDGGDTPLYFTSKQWDSIGDTSRGMMLRRHDARASLYAVELHMRRALKAGATPGQLQQLLQDLIDRDDSPA